MGKKSVETEKCDGMRVFPPGNKALHTKHICKNDDTENEPTKGDKILPELRFVSFFI